MQLADSPRKVALAFAKNGDKDTIPEDSSPSAGRASMNDGFPPETRQPVGSGGIPPQGLDMNGILYYLSLLNRWQSAGGSFAYDSDFVNDVNVAGYPKGAILVRADGTGFWLNQADGNITNPDSGGSNWQPINNVGTTTVEMTNANVTLSALQYAKDVIVVTGTLTANVNLIFPNIVKNWTIFNSTSGAYTLTAKTASGAGGLITQGTGRIFYGDGSSLYGVNPLAATQAQVNTGTDTQTFLTPKTFKDSQQLADKADKNGSASNRFKVATPVDDDEAARKDQLPVAATTLLAGLVRKATQAEMNAGTADAFPSAAEIFNGFASSGTANGYIKLPTYLSGLILQWGFNNSNTNPLTISFPIAFTTACYGVFAQSDNDLSPTELEYTGVSDITTTTFAWNGIRAGVTAFTHGWWFAIGR